MNPIDKKELDIVFTIAMPIDRTAIVNMVVSLQGIVDKKTLLNQLWFVKDVDEVLANLKEEKQEAQQEYLDSFGMQKALVENDDNNVDNSDEKDKKEDEE